MARDLLDVAVQPAAGDAHVVALRGVLGALVAQRGQLGGAGAAQFAGVLGHHFVAVGDDGFQRLVVGHGAHVTGAQLRGDLAHLGHAEDFQRADVAPGDVELVRLDRQLGRRRVGVVVVVQLFAADDDAPRHDVARRVGGFEVAVAPPVADAVDDAGGGDRDPQHLDGPDGGADGTEQRQVDDHHQRDALPLEAAVQVALDPVVRRAVAELGDGFHVLRFGAVHLAAGQQHGLDAARDGAVRIIDRLALGVVLAVNGGPFLGDHARGEPHPETEEVRRDRTQVQRAVRLAAMQPDRDAGDRDVRQEQRVQDDFPPGGVQHPMGKEVHEHIHDSLNRFHCLPVDARKDGRVTNCRGPRLVADTKMRPGPGSIPALAPLFEDSRRQKFCSTGGVECRIFELSSAVLRLSARPRRRSRPCHGRAASCACSRSRSARRRVPRPPPPAVRRRPAA